MDQQYNAVSTPSNALESLTRHQALTYGWVERARRDLLAAFLVFQSSGVPPDLVEQERRATVAALTQLGEIGK